MPSSRNDSGSATHAAWERCSGRSQRTLWFTFTATTPSNPDRIREIRRRTPGEDWEVKLEPPVNRVLPVSRNASKTLGGTQGPLKALDAGTGLFGRGVQESSART